MVPAAKMSGKLSFKILNQMEQKAVLIYVQLWITQMK